MRSVHDLVLAAYIGVHCEPVLVLFLIGIRLQDRLSRSPHQGSKRGHDGHRDGRGRPRQQPKGSPRNGARAGAGIRLAGSPPLGVLHKNQRP